MDAAKLVIFHGGCSDGFTAAWVIKTRVEGWADADFFAAAFNEATPDTSGKDVLIVDFSYPRNTLLDLERRARSLRVLDHHKTAEADLEGLPFCLFDMEKSGAGLAWDELVAKPGGGIERPWLVDTVEDRDLWRFKLEGTNEAMAYLVSQPYDFDQWERVFGDGKAAAVSAGSAITQYVNTYNENALRQAHQREITGQLVPVLNVPSASASDCGALLLERFPSAPFAATYSQAADGNWRFSLRSTDEREDVSVIAASFGGGGHRNASGFQVASLPWSH